MKKIINGVIYNGNHLQQLPLVVYADLNNHEVIGRFLDVIGTYNVVIVGLDDAPKRHVAEMLNISVETMFKEDLPAQPASYVRKLRATWASMSASYMNNMLLEYVEEVVNSMKNASASYTRVDGLFPKLVNDDGNPRCVIIDVEESELDFFLTRGYTVLHLTDLEPTSQSAKSSRCHYQIKVTPTSTFDADINALAREMGYELIVKGRWLS